MGECTDRICELLCRVLTVLTGSNDEDLCRLVACKELCYLFDALIGLSDIDDIETVSSDTVDEVFHVVVFLLGSNVDTGGKIFFYGY